MVARSTFYYEPSEETAYNLELMRLIDEEYLKHPFYGSPRMTLFLNNDGNGHGVNHKRVERLMRVMGLQAVLPGPHTSRRHPDHRVYPYLLRDVEVDHPNQVWATDITYIPMENGYMYLVAIMDWFSRYVLEWGISNTLETDFCLDTLERALSRGTPEIFNSDQGSQFTSEDFTGRLAAADVQISMDGRGRVFDNIFIERLWRTVKYEDIYLHAYADGMMLHHGLQCYFSFYNQERPHTSLGNRTPLKVYREET